MKRKCLDFVLLTNMLLFAPVYAQEGSPALDAEVPSVNEPTPAETVTSVVKPTQVRTAIGQGGKKTIFTRDTSNAKLGEAWRDPTGMIWGDIVKNKDGSIRNMNHQKATEYCNSIGSTLPSEEDFIRLRSYMGAIKDVSVEGYQPQVLPNLYHKEEGHIISNYFWASSTSSSKDAHVFVGRDGKMGLAIRHSVDHMGVRCVSGRRTSGSSI